MKRFVRKPVSGENIRWTEIKQISVPRSMSFEKVIVVAILMCVIAVSNIFLVMVEDYQREKSLEVAERIQAATVSAYSFMDEIPESALRKAKMKKAPNVVGLKVEEATDKLRSAKFKSVNIEKNTITFKELVDKSDTLFFGEVERQSQGTNGITITVAEADVSDELTVEMLSFGGRLAWPVPGSHNITSHFGKRNSPGGIGSTNHKGMDIGAVRGTPIIASKDGTVSLASVNGGYGNCVIIEHENGYKTLYGHMSVITCNVGDEVKPGDVIGKVGSTGNSTGPHLHFSIIKNGEYVDPEPYFTGKLDIEAGDEVSENVTETEEAEPSSGEVYTDVTEPIDPQEPPTDDNTEEETTLNGADKPNTQTSKSVSVKSPTSKKETTSSSHVEPSRKTGTSKKTVPNKPSGTTEQTTTQVPSTPTSTVIQKSLEMDVDSEERGE